MNIREEIKRCNEHKAELFSNKGSYDPEYFNKKLAEYDTFILNKKQQIVKQNKTKAVYKWSSVALVFIFLISFGLYFGPEFTGFTILENVSGGENVSNLTISRAPANVSVIPDISLNLTNITNLTEEVNLNYTHNLSKENVSGGENVSNLTISATPANLSVIPDISLNLTNITNLTEEVNLNYT